MVNVRGSKHDGSGDRSWEAAERRCSDVTETVGILSGTTIPGRSSSR